MKKLFKDNALSITFFLLFLFCMLAQVRFGFLEYNKENVEKHQPQVSLNAYLGSGHFIESTFENWESEFLQMALFVWLTVFLKQKGSSESKKFDGSDEVDNEPSPNKKDAPWPVKKGGWVLTLYKHSLGLTLFLLFIISFVLHLYGSLKDENEELISRGEKTQSVMNFLTDSKLWFESFQNWQSEFLSVFAIIVLSIYLREKGSSQSKPVDAPHHETGE